MRIVVESSSHTVSPLGAGSQGRAVGPEDRGPGEWYDEIRLFEGVVPELEKINDLGLSKVLADACGGRFAFVPEWNEIAYYCGGYWRRHGGSHIVDRLIKRFFEDVEDHLSGESDSEDDEAGRKVLKKVHSYDSQSKRKNLREDLKCELLVDASAFDANPHLLNVRNATIDFSGSEPVVRGHDAQDFITRMAPVMYDNRSDCLLFKHTLLDCLKGDVETFVYVQKILGLVVAGDTSRDFFVIAGTANRSGKGTVFGTVLEMLGTDDGTGYAISAQPETFAVKARVDSSGPSSDRARMRGKRLILTSEFRQRLMLDSVFLKQVTGGDLIAARMLRRNEAQFRLEGIIVMLTNEYPTVDDPAVFASDRVICLPFDRHLREENRDVTLRERLRSSAELSGLLNWCVDGYRRYLREGLVMPPAVRDKTHEFLSRGDEVGLFVEQMLKPAAGTNVAGQVVYESYCSWRERESEGKECLGRNTFYEHLHNYVDVRERADVCGKRSRSVVMNHVLREHG